MVGWNVAATWLVAGEVFIKDKYFYFISTNSIYCFMNYNEHVNAGRYMLLLLYD